jgi:hypothetical protein
MKVRKEITVAVENAPGRLGHLCECMAARKINILGISVVESRDMCLVRMVVDKPAVLAKMLKDDCPMTTSATDVLELNVPNKAGMLSRLASKLGKKRVNIEYVYGSASGRGKSTIYLRPSSIPRARALLRGL